MQYPQRKVIKTTRPPQGQFLGLLKNYQMQNLWAGCYFYATVGTVDGETIRYYIADKSNEELSEYLGLTVEFSQN